jgi:hypothetical protein
MSANTGAISRAKEFKFRVEINGLDSLLVQEFSIGKQSIALTEHAGAGQNHPTKEAGGVKFENATMRVVLPLEGEGGQFFLNRMKIAQDARTGNGQMPSAYKFVFSLYENNPADAPVRIRTFYGAQIVGVSTNNKSSLGFDKDVIDEIEIAYDRVE